MLISVPFKDICPNFATFFNFYFQFGAPAQMYLGELQVYGNLPKQISTIMTNLTTGILLTTNFPINSTMNVGTSMSSTVNIGMSSMVRLYYNFFEIVLEFTWYWNYCWDCNRSDCFCRNCFNCNFFVTKKTKNSSYKRRSRKFFHFEF